MGVGSLSDVQAAADVLLPACLPRESPVQRAAASTGHFGRLGIWGASLGALGQDSCEITAKVLLGLVWGERSPTRTRTLVS